MLQEYVAYVSQDATSQIANAIQRQKAEREDESRGEGGGLRAREQKEARECTGRARYTVGSSLSVKSEESELHPEEAQNGQKSRGGRVEEEHKGEDQTRDHH